MLTQLPADSPLTYNCQLPGPLHADTAACSLIIDFHLPPPQTNYLGPSPPTRLLEKKLAASKAPVVTVASIKSPSAWCRD